MWEICERLMRLIIRPYVLVVEFTTSIHGRSAISSDSMPPLPSVEGGSKDWRWLAAITACRINERSLETLETKLMQEAGTNGRVQNLTVSAKIPLTKVQLECGVILPTADETIYEHVGISYL
jgi:hypothetical protein